MTKRPDNLRALWVLYRAIVNINGEEYQELKEVIDIDIFRCVVKPLIRFTAREILNSRFMLLCDKCVVNFDHICHYLQQNNVRYTIY